MEKFYSKMKNPLSKGLLLMLLFFVSVAAKATDFTEIELGKGYYVPSFGSSLYYKYTATGEGTFMVKASAGSMNIWVYSDEAMSNQLAQPAIGSTSSYSKTLTTGETLYIKTENISMTDATLVFTFEGSGQETIGLKSVSPADGSTLDVTGTGKVSLTFDRAINIEGATITSGTNSKDLDVSVTNQLYAGCDYKSTLYSWLKSGVVKEGDDVVITFKGITMAGNSDVKYGTDGTLVLNYKTPKLPVSLVSITKPEKFKESWTAGDADGIVTFTFSGAISTTDLPTATISFGNLDKDSEGRYYNESITPTVSGNTITLDLTGKDRSGNVATVLSGLTDTEKAESYYTRWAVLLKGVKDAEGNAVYSEGQGTIGSFSTVIPIDDSSENKELTSEFTPSSGESIANVDNIEIYILPSAAVSSYTGVKFEYEDGNGATQEAVVAKADITVGEDADDGSMTLTVPVPAAAKTGKNVVVTLADMALASGYTGSITATYNVPEEFKVTLLSPDSTTWKTLDNGSTIKVKPTHYSEIGYMTYEIYDENGECLKSYSDNMVKDDATQTVSYEVFGDYTFYENHTYNLIFDAWPSAADKRKKQNHIGTDTIKIVGASEEFKFSTVKYVSIDPAMSSDYVIDSEDKNVFKITFDGPVWIDETITALGAESGTTVSFQSIKAIGNSTFTQNSRRYSNVWQLTAPKAFLKESPTAIGFSVKAYDKDHLLVEGNTGELAGSYLYFEYACSVGAPDFTITPAHNTTIFDKLYTFVASYDGGINPSYNVGIGKAVLKAYDSATQTYTDTVAHVVKAEPIIPDGASEYDAPTQVRLTLDKAIVNETASTLQYQLSIPYRYFILGEDMTAANSKAMTAEYRLNSVKNTQVSHSLELDLASVDPVPVEVDENSTVESLSTIKFAIKSTTEGVDASKIQYAGHCDVPVVATNEDGEEVFGTIAKVDDETTTDKCEFEATFDNAITTKGVYTVTIPEATIMLGRATHPEIKLTYNVSPAIDVVTISPDSSSVTPVTSLRTFTLTWPNETSVDLNSDCEEKIALYDVANRTVITEAKAERGTNENQIDVTLNDEVTAAGNYTLVIPAGYISLGEDYRDCAEHSFFYFIKEAAPAEAVTSDPADGSTVESLKKITLTWDNEEEVAPSFNTDLVAYVYDSEDNVVAKAGNNDVTTAEAYNAIEITLDTEITTAGTYTLKVPAAYVNLGTDGDRMSQAHEFTYTIKASASETNVTISPAEGTVASLHEFTLTWNDEGIESVDEYSESEQIVLKDADGNVVATVYVGVNRDGEVNSLPLTLDKEITAAGTYTLVIPAEYFIITDSEFNNIMDSGHTFTFTVDGTLDGINMVNADADGNYNVYNVAGMRIKKAGSKSELNGLKPGLYIINGRKVAVK